MLSINEAMMVKIMACILWIQFSLMLYAQDDCNLPFVQIFGSLIENERGYSLAASPDQNSIYVGGIKGDSAVILKLGASGIVEWTRSFDIVPGRPDHIYRLLVDSDGMIGISGIAGTPQGGGTVFVVRYNPNANQVLWAKEIISTSTNFNLGMIELGPGGNYLVSNNPASPNNAELVKMDRSTGAVISEFSKHYHLGSSESIYDLYYMNGELYGSGRFSDGGSTADMRNTLLKLDSEDGSVEWIKLGHKSGNQTARLYGLDLVVAQNEIFSAYVGDESGTSIDITKLFVQKTSLNGELRWVKQFELPGNNDWVDEILESNGGLIVFARNRVAPSDLILFKIDYNGQLLWAKKYDYAHNDNGVFHGSAQSQLIEMNGHFYFTGFAEVSANADLILVKTDLNGELTDTCTLAMALTVPVRDISNPVFYSRTPNVFDFIPTLHSLSVQKGTATSIQSTSFCHEYPTMESVVDVTICQGDQYEGYMIEGQYVDQFVSSTGCDSFRTLKLEIIDTPSSYTDTVICQGQMVEGYFTSGVYTDTLTSAFGCDSLRTIHLVVSNETPNQMFVQICEGDAFEGYHLSGFYTDTLVSSSGCDSIRMLTLEVVQEITFFQHIEICPGQQVENYSQSGIYIDTFPSVFGCDSIRTLQLTAAQPEIILELELCFGQQFEGYSNTGIYMDTLPGMLGMCDTLRYIQLTILPPLESIVNQRICFGQNYFGHTETGVHVDVLVTPEGCDSIRTVNLEVISETRTILVGSVCDAITYGYAVEGIFVDTLVSHLGCDSIRMIQLNGNHIYIPNIFSPNGDGINDIFEIISYPLTAMDLSYFTIFDRLGNMVYETAAWPVHWDGKGPKGIMCNPGVFAFLMEYNCGERSKTMRGSITLIR